MRTTLRSRAITLTVVVMATAAGCAVGSFSTSTPRSETRAPSTSPSDSEASAEPTTPAPTEMPEGTAFQPCPADAEARFSEIAARLERDLSRNGVPGGSIVIVCEGRAVFTAGVGVRRQGGGEPVTADTRFQLASTTKMFTAALAVSLAEEGIVDLHAPLATYLPFVEFGEVTLNQLLSHTAGIATGFDVSDSDLDRLLHANASMSLWSPPGAVWNYSNPGFSIAGFAMQEAAGMTYADLVRTRVTAPSGMSATFDTAEITAGDFAYGHTDDAYYAGDPIPPDGAYYATTYYHPMGGLWGSANDLGRWAEVHIAGGGDFATAASMQALTTPLSRTTYDGTSYGLGHFIDTGVTPHVVHHAGGVVGFGSEFRVVPAAGFGIGLVVNSDTYFPIDLLQETMEAFVTLSWGPLPDESTEADWPDFVGTYQDPQVFGRVEVATAGGGLVARFLDRGAESPLSLISGTTYETAFEGDIIDITFWRDAVGSPVNYLVSPWGIASR